MDLELFAVVAVGVAIGVLVALVKAKNRRKLEDEASRIVKTRIVDVSGATKSTTKTSTGSAVGRAIVGGAIGGPIGAAVGASTAKKNAHTENNDIVVFKVWYKDGTSEIKKIPRTSDYYDEYLKYLED